MMRITLLLLIAALSACDNPAPVPDRVMERQLKTAVDMVAANLGMLQDGGGYQRWTASKAVAQLVPLMNSAIEPMDGEPELPGIGQDIAYVASGPTAPYQIVLTPDDAEALIRVDGYGKNLATPVYSIQLQVPEWG